MPKKKKKKSKREPEEISFDTEPETIIEPEEFYLQKNEQVLTQETPSWHLFLLWAVDMALVGVIIGGIIGGIGSASAYMFLRLDIAIALFFWFLVTLVISFMGLLAAWMRYLKRDYWLTTHRIVYKSGFIGTNIISIPLNKIQDVSVHSSLINKIFFFENVKVVSGEHSGRQITLDAIREPKKFQKKILEAMKK